MKYGDLNLAVEWEVVRMIGRHQCQDASEHLLRVKYAADIRWGPEYNPTLDTRTKRDQEASELRVFAGEARQLILSFVQR